ncbi:MAG: hypothetical protein ACRCVX_16380, partial [Shewanella sp.]
MKSALISIALLSNISSAIAQDQRSEYFPNTVGLHLYTHHSANHLYNNQTPGVMLGWENGLVAGVYENSNSRGFNYEL